jgi:hypothetical protein
MDDSTRDDRVPSPPDDVSSRPPDPWTRPPGAPDVTRASPEFLRCRPIRPGPDLAASWKAFLQLTGGSILYCLSALSIIYGISRIMGPLLVEPKALGDATPCLGALNLYELALLGTLVFIVVWRHVTDDAISLVILIPLFLIGSGIALVTVAGSAPGVAIGIGAACAAVGIFKLAVLKRWVRLPVGWLTLAGLALVVLWGFLAGPILRWVVDGYALMPSVRRGIWLGNLLFLLVAGGICLAGIVRAKLRETEDGETPRPFLRTPPMVCLLALVLFAAAGASLYAIGYVFSVRYAWGDFAILVTLETFLLMEAILHAGRRGVLPAAVVSCVPLALVLTGLASNVFFGAPPEWSLELLGHPAFVLAATGALLVWTSFRTHWAGFLVLAGVYAVSAVMTAGFHPGRGEVELNWRLSAGLVGAILFVTGLVLRRAPLCIIAVLLGALGIAVNESFVRSAHDAGLTWIGAVGGMVGAGWLAVFVLFRLDELVPLAVLGAVGVAGCALDFTGGDAGWRDAAALPALAALAVVVCWRGRALLPALTLAAPMAVRGWVLFREMSDWRYVVLSFVLLGVGAWRSSVKGRGHTPALAEVLPVTHEAPSPGRR